MCGTADTGRVLRMKERAGLGHVTTASGFMPATGMAREGTLSTTIIGTGIGTATADVGATTMTTTTGSIADAIKTITTTVKLLASR